VAVDGHGVVVGAVSFATTNVGRIRPSGHIQCMRRRPRWHRRRRRSSSRSPAGQPFSLSLLFSLSLSLSRAQAVDYFRVSVFTAPRRSISHCRKKSPSLIKLLYTFLVILWTLNAIFMLRLLLFPVINCTFRQKRKSCNNWKSCTVCFGCQKGALVFQFYFRFLFSSSFCSRFLRGQSGRLRYCRGRRHCSVVTDEQGGGGSAIACRSRRSRALSSPPPA